MFAIIVLMTNSVIAANFAKGYVKRNRGLMLDMPDWSLIPDMTVILFQFILSGALLFAFYLQSGSINTAYIGILVIICLICGLYMSCRIWLVRKLILKKFFKKPGSEEESRNHQRRDKEEGESAQDKLEHDKRLDDAAAYAEYTLLYTIRYCLVYLFGEVLLYLIILNAAGDAGDSFKGSSLFRMIQRSFQMEDLLCVVLILEVVGIVLTFVRIFAVVQYVEKKPARKPLEKIRDYLRSDEVKH